MARTVTALSDTKIKTAKAKDKDYKLTDGRGLYLLVTKSGGKHWKLKYRIDSKEKKLALGAYPEISLADARELREEYKKQIAKDIDPSAVKQEDKRIAEVKRTKIENTFEKIARDRLLKVQDTISEAHYKRTLTALENDAFPFIGSKPVDEVTPPDIVALLHRMDERGARESARKLFYSISKTFKWAVANGKAVRSPASDIDLSEVLGERSKKNYPTITDDKGIGDLLRAIDDYSGDFTTVQALKMLPHVFVRPFNIRYAEWTEFDFKAKQWVIPASKMKTKRELIVPLSETVISILQETKQLTGDSKYLFPSARTKTAPMSDAALVNALRRMGYTKDEMVAHSFRAMFSTVAHEKSPFSHEVIETQLAHSVGNSVSQAYNRAKYLDERVRLMQWWSNYLNSTKSMEI